MPMGSRRNSARGKSTGRSTRTHGFSRRCETPARTYTMITRDLARVKSRHKSFFRSRGLPCTGEAVFKPGAREAGSCSSPSDTRSRGSAGARARATQGAQGGGRGRHAARVPSASHRARPRDCAGTRPGTRGTDVAHRRDAPPFPNKAAVLVLLRLRHRYSDVERLGARERALGTRSRGPNPRPQLQSQPDAQDALQGRGYHGDRSRRLKSAPRGLRPTTRERDKAKPGQADGGPEYRGDRAGDVENGGALRPQEDPRALQKLIAHPTREERLRPKLGSPGQRVEGKHPAEDLVPAVARGPSTSTRICPLAGPNEAMAFEARMEEWSADPQASWHEEKAQEERG